MQLRIQELAIDLELTKTLHKELNETFYDFVKTETTPKFCNQDRLVSQSGERTITSGKRLLYSKVRNCHNLITEKVFFKFFMMNLSQFEENVAIDVAKNRCKSLCGTIVQPTHSGENADLLTFAKENGLSQVWLDMSDGVKEGTWITSEAQPVKYFNWIKGQPDGESGQNNAYLEVSESGRWRDIENTTKSYVVCQV